ncbi:uncharacterized protein LOC131435314 [Malaya genurostris]|uniref:uncharacterized protein LOC131435314 n=1 Tax=Malaya genurostris TaxID=325434 RepID=UPI0026F3D67D|nr:uncharacterized protein LOC131435314 [Malaya genurostris]
MASNRIFLVEMVVEELQIFSQDPDRDPSSETFDLTSSEVRHLEKGDCSGDVCPGRCVRFQLENLARCEVCEMDFGSQVDIEHSKLGESCMFTLDRNRLHDESVPLNFVISALEKWRSGRKRTLGKWQQPANDIFVSLSSNYDNTNGRTGSRTSIETAMSEGSISKGSIPVSETIKSLYPLHGKGNIVRGYVIVTLRISCLGSRITQKVMFGTKPNESGFTCFKSLDQEDEEQFMKCVAFDASIHPHPVLCTDCEISKENLPQTPPVSVSSSKEAVGSPYDEYTAEMNGNAISIRVEKNCELKVMLPDEPDENCTKGCWTSLTMPDGVYALEERYAQREMNACRLPVVRGNLKYPAKQWSGDFMLCKQKRPICAEDFRVRPDKIRSICMQTRDPEKPIQACGVEICKKGWHDPNVDVFVLKLGKNKTSHGEVAHNQVELELRTPKGPMLEKKPKETRGVQVIEAEFEDTKRPAKEETKKPKKATKKGKKK